MFQERSARRAYGSGSLFQKSGNWFARWRIGTRQVKRRIGPVRKPGTREGLTRVQAEAELRRVMREVSVAPVPAWRTI